ncbi:MAG TPA: VOC family protein [Fimbriimonadaceae bacterium]|nr:VOC family protein [Fimbriimonadaceae bacterium]
MVTSVHTLIYSDDAPATRAFFRDVLQWPFVEDVSAEEGWFIFKTGPSEMGVHPTGGIYEGKEYKASRHHQISLMCDDVVATMKDLGSRGAEFHGEPVDYGFGIGVMMALPGADDVFLYQPKHPLAYSL